MQASPRAQRLERNTKWITPWMGDGWRGKTMNIEDAEETTKHTKSPKRFSGLASSPLPQIATDLFFSLSSVWCVSWESPPAIQMKRDNSATPFHRPVRGGCVPAIATVGGIRGVICPRLMSDAPSGRSPSGGGPFDDPTRKDLSTISRLKPNPQLAANCLAEPPLNRPLATGN